MSAQHYEIKEIWAVYQGDDDIRFGYPKWFFLTKTQAEIVAKGKGWWGANAPIFLHYAIKIDETYYLLTKTDPITVGYTKEILDEDIKEQALAKLTQEEKRVLGL